MIIASQPLHQGKSKPVPATTESPSTETQPTPIQEPQHEPQRNNDAEQTAWANYRSLMAQAQAASDPRMHQQFKQLAEAVLVKAGLKPEQLKA